MKKTIVALFSGLLILGYSKGALADSYTLSIPIEIGATYSSYNSSGQYYNDNGELYAYNNDYGKWVGGNGNYTNSLRKYSLGDGWAIGNSSQNGYGMYSIDLNKRLNNGTNLEQFNEIKSSNIISAKLYYTDFSQSKNVVKTVYHSGYDYIYETKFDTLPEYLPTQSFYYTYNDDWRDLLGNSYSESTGYSKESGYYNYTYGIDFEDPDFGNTEYLSTISYQPGYGYIDMTDSFYDIVHNWENIQEDDWEFENVNSIISLLVKTDYAPPSFDAQSGYSEWDGELGWTTALNFSHLELELSPMGGGTDPIPNPTPVPEPSSIILGLLGLGGAVGINRKSLK